MKGHKIVTYLIELCVPLVDRGYTITLLTITPIAVTNYTLSIGVSLNANVSSTKEPWLCQVEEKERERQTERKTGRGERQSEGYSE